jgi:hypothetical protein
MCDNQICEDHRRKAALVVEMTPEQRAEYEADRLRDAREALSVLISQGGSPELITSYKAQKVWFDGIGRLCDENLRSAKNSYYKAYFAYCETLNK